MQSSIHKELYGMKHLDWLDNENITLRRHWTSRVAGAVNRKPIWLAEGGFSNQDILARLLTLLGKVKKDDIIVLMSTDPSRIVMPAIKDYDNDGDSRDINGFKRSNRAGDYSCVGTTGFLMTSLWEQFPKSVYRKSWEAGMDFWIEVTDKYSQYYSEFWIDQNINRILDYLEPQVHCVVTLDYTMWKQCHQWKDYKNPDMPNDPHWSDIGWKEAAQIVTKAIEKGGARITHKNFREYANGIPEHNTRRKRGL